MNEIPDIEKVYAETRSAIEENIRQYAIQDVGTTEILFKPRVGGMQNGKSLPGVWFDEAQRLVRTEDGNRGDRGREVRDGAERRLEPELGPRRPKLRRA